MWRSVYICILEVNINELMKPVAFYKYVQANI